MADIIAPSEVWIWKKNAGMPLSVFKDITSLPSKLLGLSDRPRATSPGESVGHMADDSPLVTGLSTDPMPFSEPFLSANGKWRAVIVYPDGWTEMLAADEALPPEEQKLTGLERASLAVLIGQSELKPEWWDDPDAP